MIRIYIIGLITLALILLGLIVYIFFRRAYLRFSNWDERRRTRYWKPIIKELIKQGSLNIAEELNADLSDRDIKIINNLCIENLSISKSHTRDQLIQWLRDHGFIKHCIDQVTSENRWDRAKAIEILGILKVNESESILLAALDDQVFDVRIRAAKALGSLGGKRAQHALISVLGDEGRWSIIRIADILGQMGPSVVNDLIDAFPKLGTASRLAALDIIIRLVDNSHLQFLFSCLSDNDMEVRTRAVTGLGNVGNATALPMLLYSLHDRDWPVRAKSAKALGELGLSHSIPSLIECLSDNEWWVRQSAAEALSRLGDEGTEALIHCLSSTDVFCRDQAFSMLQSTGQMTNRLEEITSRKPEAIARAQNLAAKLIEHLSLQGFIDFCEAIPNTDVRKALWDMYKRYSKYSESAA